MSVEINARVAASLREYFESRQGKLLKAIREVVESESPSGDVEGSRQVVDLLADVARSIDGVSDVERIVNRDYGEHLRLRAFDSGAEGARPTLILGHTDTVYERGSLQARPWREEAGRIYAPGIFDMKANCVLALEALRACAVLHLKPARPVVVLFTCDEETGSHSGRALVEEEARRAAQVLVLEPPASGGRVKTARKGTGMFTLKVEGRAAHAGLEPEKGASAILEIARQIEKIHSLSDPARGVTLNVGVVCGGTRSNVVAAEARAEIDLRFGTKQDAEQLEQQLLNLQPFDARVQLKMEGGINRPPLERTAAVAELYERAKAIAAAMNYELNETSVGGASDGNFAAAVGAPVLDGLGVDGDGAHAVHEHIIVDDLARRGALLAGLIASL
ncbi:MAG: M20 family metallopeptidase [Pyrinomonadaceae bacterium]|nr:M20 family metallopeptidase [Pyrinomonadaceae bacterium]MDQ3586186.1 M20 family metallopeptidase [Acidobacteriota bacterium]